MSGYPSITLQSHTTLQSSDDSFVQHSQNTHRGITLLNKLRSIFTEPSIFGGKPVNSIQKGPIICIAWHPSQRDQIAFGMSDGGVQVIIQPSTKPISLRNQHQRDVRCVAWQPNSSKTLSVGCSNGILVWEVVSQKTSSLPSRTTFHHTSAPVTSISYTPDGRHCLVTTMTKVMVFDCVMWEFEQCIRSISYPNFILVSPKITFTLLAEGTRFHILRGITEGTETYTRLGTHVQSAVWAPSGSHLLFSLSSSPLVLYLEVFVPEEVNSKISQTTDILVDLQKTLVCKEGEKWGVEELTLDDTGQRLAVMARDANSSVSKIFVFSVCLSSHSVYELDVIGETMSPTRISYQHNTNQGALLCVCCENGNVNFIPDLSLVST